MGDNIHGTFISEKPYKIRWKPEEYFESRNFLTGSWDNDVNTLKLWSYNVNEEDSSINPFVVQKQEFLGDVTEIQFISKELAVVSSSCGYVKLFNIIADFSGSADLNVRETWEKLHYFGPNDPSPCTALSVHDEDIVTVGEDGRINLLTAQVKKTVRVIDNADSCSLHCVCFLRHNEVLTGNLRGQMKIWDLRTDDDEPASTFMLGGAEQNRASCLTYHPTQRHIILAGGEDGSLTVWDLRQNTLPVTLLDAHKKCVSEIRFHPQNPDRLFSCSQGGEIWHWNASLQRSSNTLLTMDPKVNESMWISSDISKNKLEVFALMPTLHKPINSLDVIGNKILCGCDNEAIYIINNIEM